MQVIKLNQDSIAAILEGRKTTTRRPIKSRSTYDLKGMFERQYLDTIKDNKINFIKRYAKYKIGETVELAEVYENDPNNEWRLTGKHIKITNIKVERLQNISFEDRYKEGCPLPYDMSAYEDESLKWFENDIWNKLPYQPRYDWNSDPYVFVYEFEIVK